MKLTKIVLHTLIIISIITGIYSGIYIEKDENTYMTKKQADKCYAMEFYNQVSEKLEEVGKIAEFNDKYGSDDSSLKYAEEYTIGQLKEKYKQDNNIVNEYKDLIGKIFYYEKDNLEYKEGVDKYVSDMQTYTPEEIKKYGYSSMDEYNDASKKYNALYNFFVDYQDVNAIEKSITQADNLEYVIKYTDQRGKEINYSSENGNNILKNRKKYKTYFLYDKINSNASLINMNKDNADYQSLVYKCKTFSDYNDFYALFSVNDDYIYDDDLYFYAKQVITNQTQISRHNSYIMFFLAACIVCAVSVLLMCYFTGKGDDGKITIAKTDRFWWDVEGIAILIIAGAILSTLESMQILKLYTELDMKCFGVAMFIIVEVLILYFLSIIRRLKVRKFFETSFIGSSIKKIVVIWKKILDDRNAAVKAIANFAVTVVYLIIVLLVIGFGYGSLDAFTAIMLLVSFILFTGVQFLIIWKFESEYNTIARKTKKIATGDITNKIKDKFWFNSNRNMAECVNSIGEGIHKAVEENVKNERMKTDLITNVSHDIKTPLTSIINYVNLIKMEDIEDEKIKNYVKVLDEKSQRLKILTDDLVEASKLSSGVIKLDFAKLNLVELIKQSAGEYEEKFEEKQLEVIMNLPVSPVYVNADGRKMWRVLENLYGNIYKYALKGTRVYVDLSTVNGKVILFVKNISNTPLNVETDDLSERFIRGDVSRSTEGSGLGLSIARSVIERHNGVFKITLDGDLFKVMIKLDEYVESEEESES